MLKTELYMQPVTPATGVLMKRARPDEQVIGMYNTSERMIVLSFGLNPADFSLPDPLCDFNVVEFTPELANLFYNKK